MASKNYQVYGVGNALVDYEVEVTDNQLETLNVEKGVMTLIDEERHYSLMSHLEGTRHNRACGGSAANTIIGIAQLGGAVFYSCRVGNDETGDFYLQDLQSNAVEINKNVHRPEGVTGKCVVMVTPDADRTMNTFLGVTGDLGTDVLDIDAIKSSEYLYVEGYLVSAPMALDAACTAMQMAREYHVPIAVSLSDPSMVNFFRAGIDRLLVDGVDLLFCNEDEALTYTGQTEVAAALEQLKTISKKIVITLGAKGSVIWDGARLIQVAGHNVVAKDTNGAGDMYAGAFLYAITQGMNEQNAGKLASYCSAQVVQKFGPRLDSDAVDKAKSFLRTLNQ
ncbi:MAG: adenosine kinase [Gammaproteobacteria bacterium CG22_combo_CG10-13_8_21_14_all_40_8]|nr:MAG: adenosine kinase [Gammaproteobacteria bacterium CG22_combo_CG10-13_8_21_14_all_40_8]